MYISSLQPNCLEAIEKSRGRSREDARCNSFLHSTFITKFTALTKIAALFFPRFVVSAVGSKGGLPSLVDDVAFLLHLEAWNRIKWSKVALIRLCLRLRVYKRCSLDTTFWLPEKQRFWKTIGTNTYIQLGKMAGHEPQSSRHKQVWLYFIATLVTPSFRFSSASWRCTNLQTSSGSASWAAWWRGARLAWHAMPKDTLSPKYTGPEKRKDTSSPSEIATRPSPEKVRSWFTFMIICNKGYVTVKAASLLEGTSKYNIAVVQ